LADEHPPKRTSTPVDCPTFTETMNNCERYFFQSNVASFSKFPSSRFLID
jgi:hypothetical protein